MRQLGFKGTLINGHSRGRYLDDKFFWPILERADALNVPVYRHPTVPPKAVVEASYSGFAPAVTASRSRPVSSSRVESCRSSCAAP